MLLYFVFTLNTVLINTDHNLGKLNVEAIQTETETTLIFWKKKSSYINYTPRVFEIGKYAGQKKPTTDVSCFKS